MSFLTRIISNASPGEAAEFGLSCPELNVPPLPFEQSECHLPIQIVIQTQLNSTLQSIGELCGRWLKAKAKALYKNESIDFV